jgi:hypothetical protein
LAKISLFGAPRAVTPARVPDSQSSRLAVFGGRGMSFNIARGTLGSLAMFTAIRNASSRVSLFIDNRRCDSSSK